MDVNIANSEKGVTKHGKIAVDSINKEFTMLLQEKRVITPVKRNYISRQYFLVSLLKLPQKSRLNRNDSYVDI